MWATIVKRGATKSKRVIFTLFNLHSVSTSPTPYQTTIREEQGKVDRSLIIHRTGRLRRIMQNMVQLPNSLNVHVLWKGRKFVLGLGSDASLEELGEELRVLTDVKADTVRLIIPQSTKGSKLFLPFSDEHSCIKLQDTGIVEGKPIRMMGVYEHEVNQLQKDAKANLRIAGFEDEEKRMKQRISSGPLAPFKLPQGPYIFNDFRTLELPGVELNPPPSEALKRMHMLACDPGIIAIMNKHRWRVGIMTEMAPVGYVGISPICLLGFNKNHGEEISLRLRTDDLKGFRKYESVKKTLLHELAHMIFSEHDSNFYALEKQLRQEAFALDWTTSRSHTLIDKRSSGHSDVDLDLESESSFPQKLGGAGSYMATTAREASVAAAYHRLEDSSATFQGSSACKEHDSVDHVSEADGESISVSSGMEKLLFQNQYDNWSNNHEQEPDPDDSGAKTMNLEHQVVLNGGITQVEHGPHIANSHRMQIESATKSMINTVDKPDSDDYETRVNQLQPTKVVTEPESDDLVHAEHDLDDADENTVKRAEPNPDHNPEPQPQILGMMMDEPDPDDQELKRIQHPVNEFCNHLTKAIQKLCSDLRPSVSKEVLAMLYKIIRNVSQNPNEVRYKRLRKANPVFQKTIANYKAAMDILFLIGFSEDIVTDKSWQSETFLVLKRNDPGLVWLAKSTLETYISQ